MAAPAAASLCYDPAKKTFTKIAITNEPRKDWGDPACPGPPGDELSSARHLAFQANLRAMWNNSTP